MKNLQISFLFLLSFILLPVFSSEKEAGINLSGKWFFAMDSLDVGEKEAWYSKKFEEVIMLPGSMASNGKGLDITLNTEWVGGIQNVTWYKDPRFAPYHDPENIRFPYWLQPEKKYTGAAWYQKEIFIPDEWENKHIFLNLERCHWESTVWLDDQKLGSQNSLSTPHQYGFIGKGGRHTLTIKVDNRIKDVDVGINSHSISDHTQSNWNGIAGDISLQAKESIYIERIKLTPNFKENTLEIQAQIINGFDSVKSIRIKSIAKLEKTADGPGLGQLKKDFQLKKGENEISFVYKLGEDALLWDEFNPNLYQLNLTLSFDEQDSEYTETFGLREIRVENNQLTINKRKLFLRGTLECAIFPLTGYPSTDKEEWRRIYRAIKAHGLNHMRFHSWCPPKAAFQAADEEGIYLQVECASWANQSTSLGDGHPVDQFIWDESKKIVEEYGNHPSLCLMAYGNEPRGNHQKVFLTDFLSYWKQEDKRRLYTSAAGWPELPENDFHNIPGPRIQGWGEELQSIINAEPPSTNYDWHSRHKMPDDNTPVISHEIGQWCVYPNFGEMKKYSGVLKARNFELFQASLEANGLGYLADSFLLASGKLQALCYKADIEAALRTKDFGGFQLLDLHDFPGQGTALVGVLDPFWEEKGYIAPSEFKDFCNSVVPLLRLDKRIYSEGETLSCRAEISNYGADKLIAVIPHWQILNQDGTILARGSLDQADLPRGNGIKLGQIQYNFSRTGKAQKLKIQLSVADFTNSWDIWVYPEYNQPFSSQDILITDKLDRQSIKALDRGESVLLSLGRGKVKEGKGGEVGVGFSSIFWNTAWTRNQKPHTLGILCDPGHPALAMFPTEYHSNWQWWDAMSHSDVINLNEIPAELKPIVRVIDDWFSNRPLGLLFEVKIGEGKLLVSGIDLINNLETRPEARQLLYSLNNYMNGPSFEPEISVDPDQIRAIIR